MASTPAARGFLGWIERTGNRLPDPVFIFLYLIAALVAVSAAPDGERVTARGGLDLPDRVIGPAMAARR